MQSATALGGIGYYVEEKTMGRKISLPYVFDTKALTSKEAYR